MSTVNRGLGDVYRNRSREGIYLILAPSRRRKRALSDPSIYGYSMPTQVGSYTSHFKLRSPESTKPTLQRTNENTREVNQFAAFRITGLIKKNSNVHCGSGEGVSMENSLESPETG